MLEEALAKPVLRVCDIWVEYSLSSGLLSKKKKIYALRGVSFDVSGSEVFGIVGASGSGKSTLLKAIMGFVSPSSGSIEIDDVDILKVDRGTRKNILRKMGYVSQNPLAAVNPRFKVGDIVAEPLKAAGLSRKEITKMLPTLIESVDLPLDVVDLLPHELSLGMLQRVVIARAIATKPRILLLDEPTSALDTVTQSHIVVLLKELKDLFGFASVLVSHDLKVVSHLADRLAILMAGLVLEEGTTYDVLRNPLHPYTRELVDSIKLKEVKEVFTIDPRTCPFYAHCYLRLEDRCRRIPPLIELGRRRKVRCWLYS
ncbi:MAG: ABC transporter ATP-binding protein [Sulfolobales archaeon]|nr:ABC transporter ATP-binding protein [Sulfolobales archaeon]MDW8011205.1 ABC transporter ATP-binding protein [Sulfolobales archaeon]